MHVVLSRTVTFDAAPVAMLCFTAQPHNNIAPAVISALSYSFSCSLQHPKIRTQLQRHNRGANASFFSAQLN